MWRLLFKLIGMRVCATEDFDGEVRYRFFKTTVFFRRISRGIGDTTIILLDDGTVAGESYVRRWKEI